MLSRDREKEKAVSHNHPDQPMSSGVPPRHQKEVGVAARKKLSDAKGWSESKYGFGLTILY